MVRQCVICKILDRKQEGLSFHKFPTNLERKRQWLSVLNIPDERITSRRSVICSKHFNKGDFLIKPSGLKHLCPKAVPFFYDGANKEDISINSIKVESIISDIESSPNKDNISVNLIKIGPIRNEIESSPNMNNISVNLIKVEPIRDEIESSPNKNSISVNLIKVEPIKSEFESSANDVNISENLINFESITSEFIIKSEQNSSTNESDSDNLIENIPKQRFSSRSSTSSTITISPSDLEETLTASDEALIALANTRTTYNSCTLERTLTDPEVLNEQPIVSSRRKIYRKRRCYIGDFNSGDCNTSENFREFLNLSKTKFLSQQKKIKTLQTTVRRLKRKVMKLQTLISVLKKQFDCNKCRNS